MMSITHLYTDFGTIQDPFDDEAPMGMEAIEESKLEAFETGYQAGWDDAVRAHETEKARISSEFAQNLLDMSFSYHEAMSKLTVALQPLLELMVSKVLPDLAQASLGSHIQEQLRIFAKSQMESSIEIAVSPENFEALSQLLDSTEVEAPFKLKAEPSMAAGQVYLRNSTEEREIDLDGLLLGISDAVKAFFHESKKDIEDDRSPSTRG